MPKETRVRQAEMQQICFSSYTFNQIIIGQSALTNESLSLFTFRLRFPLFAAATVALFYRLNRSVHLNSRPMPISSGWLDRVQQKLSQGNYHNCVLGAALRPITILNLTYLVISVISLFNILLFPVIFKRFDILRLLRDS